MLTGTADDPRGFLRELMVLIAQTEGLKVEFVPIDTRGDADQREALARGGIDVLAGATVGEGNLRDFRLSAPVIVTPGVAVTRAGTYPPKTVEDLRKLRVAVPAGGAGRQFAVEQDIQASPKHFFGEGFQNVVSGDADAMLTTMLAANWEIEHSGLKGLQLSVLEPAGFRRAYAYATRPDDAALMVAIESGLITLQHDGRFNELYEREVARYQPTEWPRSVSLSSVLHYATVVGLALLVAGAVWQWRNHRRVANLGRAAAESEERYRGIFNQSHDAIAVIDAETGCIIEANRAAEHMYGYGPGEMIGVHYSQLVVDSEKAAQRFEQTMANGLASFDRVRHRQRAGGAVIAEVRSTVGTIGGKKALVALVRDVTAAASYEELIRSVIESSPRVAIQGFDRSGRIHFWNAASQRLYGWTPQEAIGREVGELIADAGAQRELVALLATLEKEHRPSGLMEVRLHSKSGEPRWVLSEIVPAPDLRGELQFVCVDIDVSAMKLAERRLQDAQGRLSAALEAAGMGTWSIDVPGRTISVDPPMARLLGLGAGLPESIPLSDAGVNLDPRDVDAVGAAFQSAVVGENDFKVEYRVVLPGTGTRWLSSRGRLIRDPSGAVIRISGAAVDLTDAKQAAADAERLRDELERARRLESLGLLAGGLAHDFNNLLVGIRGNTELALRAAGDESPARRALELVVQATDRTAELTGQLLAAAGRSRLDPEPIDLNAFAVESVELYRARLGQGVQVVFDLADPPARTLADGGQTRQAMSNLLTNAADAMAGREKGLITIRTGAQRLSRADLNDPAFKVRGVPGDYVFIEVADNGCGMDDRVLARMFDPFYSTKATGRGLGLSLVMMTVRRHEGVISVESTPGRGTVCRVYLPRVAVGAARPQSEEPSPPPAAGTALVIDDEPMVRSVITGMLGHEQWLVVEADSGEAGLRALSGRAFDLIFLDLTMPGMSGIETAAALRAVRPAVPIVFVSGYSREMADAGGALAGEVFVQKPFDSARLMAAAAEAIDRARRADRAAARASA